MLIKNNHKRFILTWLFSLVSLILLIVVIGGITRLTDSGLSMVDWRPVMGIIPPITQVQWDATFLTYQQFPEFQKINVNITLSEFKFIFFWEYLHRILGRIIGLTIILPFIYFLFKKSLSSYLIKRSMVMIILVLAQGLMGWYMVKSGLVDAPDVSHFRLSAHLLLAFVLLQYILWTVYRIIFEGEIEEEKPPTKLCLGSVIITLMIMFQIMYGAFVSGLDAGYGYNTFPKMGDSWLPESAFILPSFLENVMNNRVMIQFIHRTLAWVLLGIIALFYFVQRRHVTHRYQLKAMTLFLSAFVFQFFLGVFTLVYKIPFSFALLHQFGGLLLFSSSIFLTFTHRYFK